jgi:adenylylsulfate kinase
MKIILIMGLPGSGKTTLARELVSLLKAKWLNADKVRTEYNDWDFSEEGRVRQANRMKDLAKKLREEGNYVVADFVCPTREARKLFGADYTIWMDTIQKGRFDDTNQMFVKPINFDFKVDTFDAKNWSKKIHKEIIK